MRRFSGRLSTMSIELGTNNRALRDQPAKITRPADAEELKEQIQQIANLGRTTPHSVSLVQENIPGSPRFNCYQRSFGLADVRFRVGAFEVVPGRAFAQFLVDYH